MHAMFCAKTGITSILNIPLNSGLPKKKKTGSAHIFVHNIQIKTPFPMIYSSHEINEFGRDLVPKVNRGEFVSQIRISPLVVDNYVPTS